MKSRSKESAIESALRIEKTITLWELFSILLVFFGGIYGYADMRSTLAHKASINQIDALGKQVELIDVKLVFMSQKFQLLHTQEQKELDEINSSLSHIDERLEKRK